jgi:Na+-transporting NADH:ubiquinone oxidoreductase subunit NqrC
MKIKISLILLFVLIVLVTTAAMLPTNIIQLKPGQTRQAICTDGQQAYVLDSDAFGLVIGCPNE